MKSVLVSVVLAACTLAVPVVAQDAIRKEAVAFKAGASSATIKGSIKGDQTVDYTLRAKAGQSMVVDLKTANTSVNFNVLPPGSEEAVFIGSVSGTRYEGTLPKDGEYTVRLFLMGNAARRGATAAYTITFSVDAKPAAK